MAKSEIAQMSVPIDKMFNSDDIAAATQLAISMYRIGYKSNVGVEKGEEEIFNNLQKINKQVRED